jgi:hypothetical protein
VHGGQARSPRAAGLPAAGFAPLYEDVALRLGSALRFWQRGGATTAAAAGAAGGSTGDGVLRTRTQWVTPNGDRIEIDDP